MYGIGLGLLLYIQHLTDTHLFSFVNFRQLGGGTIEYHKMFRMFILTPLREEMVCRGFLFLILYRHSTNPIYGGTPPNPPPSPKKGNPPFPPFFSHPRKIHYIKQRMTLSRCFESDIFSGIFVIFAKRF